MGSIAIHRILRRRRRQMATLVAICALGGLVAVAHSGVEGMHMPAMAAWCLAVLPLVAAAAVVSASPRRPVSRAALVLLPSTRAHRVPPPVPRARAGPTRFTVLRL